MYIKYSNVYCTFISIQNKFIWFLKRQLELNCVHIAYTCLYKNGSIIPVPLYPFKIRLDYYTVSSFIHLVKFYLSSLTRNQSPESCSCYEQFDMYTCILYKHNMYFKRQQKTFIIFGTITCLSNGYFYVRIH